MVPLQRRLGDHARESGAEVEEVTVDRNPAPKDSPCMLGAVALSTVLPVFGEGRRCDPGDIVGRCIDMDRLRNGCNRLGHGAVKALYRLSLKVQLDNAAGATDDS